MSSIVAIDQVEVEEAVLVDSCTAPVLALCDRMLPCEEQQVLGALLV